MRKLFALIISVFLIWSCVLTVGAAEAKYNTAGELYEAWHDNLPNYICGVWSTDGGTSNLTFGIQNNEKGHAGKQQILELIENDSSVTFVYQQFSRNDLLQMQKEIDVYFEKNSGLLSTGLNETDNCIVVGIYKDRKDNADTKAMVNEITGKYGKAVRVEYTDKVVHTVESHESEAPNTWVPLYAQPRLFLPMVMIFLLLIGVVFVIAIRRKMFLLQTKQGTIGSATSMPSAKEVQDIVKKTNCHVPADLKQKVMTAIEKNE